MGRAVGLLARPLGKEGLERSGLFPGPTAGEGSTRPQACLLDPNLSLHGAMEMPTKSLHNTRIALQALQGACSKSFLEREFWVPPKWPLASVVVMSLLLKTHRMTLTGNHHCTLLRALTSASWNKLRAHLVSEAAQHYGVPRPSG